MGQTTRGGNLTLITKRKKEDLTNGKKIMDSWKKEWQWLMQIREHQRWPAREQQSRTEQAGATRAGTEKVASTEEEMWNVAMAVLAEPAKTLERSGLRWTQAMASTWCSCGERQRCRSRTDRAGPLNHSEARATVPKAESTSSISPLQRAERKHKILQWEHSIYRMESVENGKHMASPRPTGLHTQQHS
jgi:hypothetical protein